MMEFMYEDFWILAFVMDALVALMWAGAIPDPTLIPGG